MKIQIVKHDIEFTEEQTKNNNDWIAAIRSGEYIQGAGRLRITENGSFCCLGVDCKIADLEMPDEGGFIFFGSIHLNTASHNGWFKPRHGFDVDKDIILIERHVKQLTEMNDNLKFSFNQIADCLEAFINGVKDIEIDYEW